MHSQKDRKKGDDKKVTALTSATVLIDRQIPRIGNGAISDTYVCVPTKDAPSAKPVTIFPPRYCAGVSAVKLTAIPTDAVRIHVRKMARRPSRSWMGPAAMEPTMVMTLNKAFQRDCQ